MCYLWDSLAAYFAHPSIFHLSRNICSRKMHEMKRIYSSVKCAKDIKHLVLIIVGSVSLAFICYYKKNYIFKL